MMTHIMFGNCTSVNDSCQPLKKRLITKKKLLNKPAKKRQSHGSRTLVGSRRFVSHNRRFPFDFLRLRFLYQSQTEYHLMANVQQGAAMISDVQEDAYVFAYREYIVS